MPLLSEFCKLFPACAPLYEMAQENLEYWKVHPGNADPCDIPVWLAPSTPALSVSSGRLPSLTLSNNRLPSFTYNSNSNSRLPSFTYSNSRLPSFTHSNSSSSHQGSSFLNRLGPAFVGGKSFKQVYANSFKQVYANSFKGAFTNSFKQVREEGNENDIRMSMSDVAIEEEEQEGLVCDMEAPPPSDRFKVDVVQVKPKAGPSLKNIFANAVDGAE
eukprot:903860-Prorocentrum_minimum.AAC.1